MHGFQWQSNNKPAHRFIERVSEHVWRTKYQWLEAGQLRDPDIEATWDRVALAVSGAEPHHQNDWRERFRAILNDFRFLPGGRILAHAGTSRQSTLFNCFVLGLFDDSIQGIFNVLREAMLTLQAGGGVGVDFSCLRPAGSVAVASGGIASGPVSFLGVWEEACRVLEQGNVRRGAMMATLRCDHPDIESFIQAKLDAGALSHFNLSVAVTDDFMRAVESDSHWALVFPLRNGKVETGQEVCTRVWPGSGQPQPCRVHRRVSARALWDKLVGAELASAEPGVLFIDHINRDNNLWYAEQLVTTNPCGEVPLPASGACNLGSINLPRFVKDPFSEHPRLDFGEIKSVTTVATRFLDDVYDVSAFPLKSQRNAGLATRRIGLGITGLGDALAMLGLRYGSPASVDLIYALMSAIRDTAYRTSVALAMEKGAFSQFDKVKYGAGSFVLNLPHDIQDAILQHGIRNSHLLAIAPAGSISLLANNVSSGIEPIFTLQGERQIRGADGQRVGFKVENAAWHLYRQKFGERSERPAYLPVAGEISTDDQLRVATAVQSCVDNAVSKSVWLAENAGAHQLGNILRSAWELGLKGIAVYRPGSRGGQKII